MRFSRAQGKRVPRCEKVAKHYPYVPEMLRGGLERNRTAGDIKVTPVLPEDPRRLHPYVNPVGPLTPRTRAVVLQRPQKRRRPL